jgi:hypothetical protein
MGGSFSFDEDTMRGLVKEWYALADSYDASRTVAHDMLRVEGPGLDFASSSYADAASRSGAAYVDYLSYNRDYCVQQAELFQHALDDYLGVEHANVVDIDRSGADEPPRPGISGNTRGGRDPDV